MSSAESNSDAASEKHMTCRRVRQSVLRKYGDLSRPSSSVKERPIQAEDYVRSC